jgi:16S rRNA processing protein RimM
MNIQSENKNLRKIGKFSHAHGLRGELYLVIFSGDYNWFEDVTEIYLEVKAKDNKLKTQLQDYKIKSFRPHKEGILVTLVGVDNRNQSDELSGHEVWVSADVFVTAEDDDEIFLVEIEGFEVFDSDNKIGTIVGFSYNGAQDLLIVAPDSSKEATTAREVYEIPFVEQFIEDINYEEKKIIMNLPEGLIDVQKSSLKTPNKISKDTQ